MEKVGKENNERQQSTAGISRGRDANGSVVQTPLSASSNYGNSSEDFEGDNASETYASGTVMDFIFRGKPNVKSRKSIASNTGGPPSIVHLPQVPDTMKQGDQPPTERDQVEMEVIKSLIDSYFKIVRKNFIDLVPKTIMYFLVNHVTDGMQNELVGELYREAEVGNLMKEADDIAQRRQTCEEMGDLLTKAMEIVNEVRDFNTFRP